MSTKNLKNIPLEYSCTRHPTATHGPRRVCRETPLSTLGLGLGSLAIVFFFNTNQFYTMTQNFLIIYAAANFPFSHCVTLILHISDAHKDDGTIDEFQDRNLFTSILVYIQVFPSIPLILMAMCRTMGECFFETSCHSHHADPTVRSPYIASDDSVSLQKTFYRTLQLYLVHKFCNMRIIQFYS